MRNKTKRVMTNRGKKISSKKFEVETNKIPKEMTTRLSTWMIVGKKENRKPRVAELPTN